MIDLTEIPSSKQESWKYTNIQRFLKKLNLFHADLGWGTDSSFVKGLEYSETQLWDLNSRKTNDVRIVSKSEEIQINASKGQWISPRLVVAAKDHETITIVERYSGDGEYWKNAAVQISVGKNATLRHYRVFDEYADALSTVFTHAKISEKGRYESFNLISGGGIVRNQFYVELEGEHAFCGISGVNLLSGEQHADTTITIEHKVPQGKSRQMYKSVLDEKSRGVFQGKVHVQKIAQKTDAYQLSNALLLSSFSEMDTKPELEIYADDVKCSHGATVGQMDDEPLFYMRSRGISEREARHLLIRSFCGGAVEEIGDENIRNDVWERISEWLASRA